MRIPCILQSIARAVVVRADATEMMNMKKITEYQVVDHGFDAEQSFQGCGVSFTDFEDVSTGVGDTATEALEDALECLSQSGWDVSSVRHSFGRGHQLTVLGYLKRIGFTAHDIENGDGSETHYYVSVRVK